MSDDRIFIGMTRPSLDEAKLASWNNHMGYCPSCRMCQHTSCGWTGQLGECYRKGHFDIPVYATRDEILDRMAKAAVDSAQKSA